MRMLMNNLDPAVAEKPEELIVYGGGGKAALVTEHLPEDHPELAAAREREIPVWSRARALAARLWRRM